MRYLLVALLLVATLSACEDEGASSDSGDADDDLSCEDVCEIHAICTHDPADAQSALSGCIETCESSADDTMEYFKERGIYDCAFNYNECARYLACLYD